MCSLNNIISISYSRKNIGKVKPDDNGAGILIESVSRYAAVVSEPEPHQSSNNLTQNFNIIIRATPTTATIAQQTQSGKRRQINDNIGGHIHK